MDDAPKQPRRRWFQFSLSTWLVLVGILALTLELRPIFTQELVTYTRQIYSVEESALYGAELGAEVRTVNAPGVQFQGHYKFVRTQWEHRFSSAMALPVLALAAFIFWKFAWLLIGRRRQRVAPKADA